MEKDLMEVKRLQAEVLKNMIDEVDIMKRLAEGFDKDVSQLTRLLKLEVELSTML